MIKANRPSLVKSRRKTHAAIVFSARWAALLVPLLALAATALAQDTPDPELPPIEAKPFATNVLKRSNSLRVYMLEAKDYMPRVGKIVLLKREAENIMAFRVIKTYDDEKRFAARKVKEYGGRKLINLGEAFLALEKLRDLGPYQPTAEDIKLDNEDLKELEGPAPPEGLPPVSPYDDELDAGTSPPPTGAVDDDGAGEVENDDSDLENLVADEVMPFDPDYQWLSAEFGFFKNFNKNKETVNYSGGGVRYAITAGKLIFLSSLKAQDSLALELGVSVYKILEFDAKTETYTVMPLTGTVRYNIVFSEDFSIFFYTGLNMNVVLSASQGTRAHLALLSSTLPAGGAGAFFRIGPKWHARVDAGVDMIGAGLVLRF